MQQLPSKAELLDRLPPYSPESERGVLGSVLCNPRILDRVMDVVRPGDFYVPANQTIFQTILALDMERQPIDMVVMLERLRSVPPPDDSGWAPVLGEVLHVPHAAHAVYYAGIVAGHAKRRRLIQSAESLLHEAWDTDSTVEDVLGRHEQQLAAVVENGQSPLASAAEVAIQVGDRIDAICERKQHLGLPTGFLSYDEQFGGLFGSEFIILAARPGRGKSALACQIVDYVGQSGRWVYVVSLEMSAVELAIRSICNHASVNGRSLRTGRVNTEDRAALVESLNRYGTAKLWLDTRSELTIEMLLRTARRLLRDSLSLIVIDYLQLLVPSDQKAKRYEQVGQQTRALKMMARELNVPVVVLCQLNRQAADESEPQLHHLRESGSCEQDADVVLLLHRPEEGIQIPDPDKPKAKKKADWPAELIIAKNRNGQIGRLKLDWEAQYTRFSCWGASQQTNYDPAFAEFA